MFDVGYNTLPSIHPSSVQVQQGSHLPLPDLNTTLSSTPNGASLPTAPASAPQHGDALFWTPVPGVGAPIFPRDLTMSAMDLNNLLGDVDGWDRYERDGFKISEAWTAVEPMAYVSNAHINQVVGDPIVYTTNPPAYPIATSRSSEVPGLVSNETQQYDQWWPPTAGGGQGPAGGAGGPGGA